MAFAELQGVRMHFEIAGPEGAPVLMFSNPLGTDLSVWDGQAGEFARTFRVLRYDKRGHGKSSVPPGPYTIEMLTRDAIALLDFLKIEKVHFCGLSIGGQTGMWIGVNAPERLNKLVLSNTGAKIGTEDGWNKRIDAVNSGGTRSMAEAILERWFTFEFRASQPPEVTRVREVLEQTDTAGYVACCAAVRDFDYRDKVDAIRASTLVISGTHDPGAPPQDGRYLSGHIPGSRYVELNASHIANIEARERFTVELSEFLGA
jgi:3-oxoadipate enol-lactonase